MFGELSSKLDRALGRFRQRGILTEPLVRDGLREIRRTLLEADVHFRVTKAFVRRVEERALGAVVVKGVSPGQQIVKIVHDELAGLLGEEASGIRWSAAPPTVVLLVGLQGSGKTTTAAKLARRFRSEGREPMLAACDLQRPAATEQLETLGRTIGVEVFSGEPGGDPVALGRRAQAAARAAGKAVLVVDTAGRLQIDAPLMAELGRFRAELAPEEILLVADAMTGQEAVRIAEGFDAELGLTGIVLTKMEGDARGGAALSIREVVGRPIKFIGVGEEPGDLEPVDPKRLAGRILNRGDVVGLVERAAAAAAAEGEARTAPDGKAPAEGPFDLEALLGMFRQVKRMGALEEIASLVPGIGPRLPAGAGDPKRIRHMEAIILSMTPGERRSPEVIGASRRRRIARGSGRPVAEVNRLLKSFREMGRARKALGSMAGAGGWAGAGFPAPPVGRGRKKRRKRKPAARRRRLRR
ncbi:MAG: signal recognition particle protein [Gammaproteobacteria bacterium]|nr:signal recognition particle protein [Gammaproteobacteria bacterium]